MEIFDWYPIHMSKKNYGFLDFLNQLRHYKFLRKFRLVQKIFVKNRDFLGM